MMLKGKKKSKTKEEEKTIGRWRKERTRPTKEVEEGEKTCMHTQRRK
jgi:hypothetical protein